MNGINNGGCTLSFANCCTVSECLKIAIISTLTIEIVGLMKRRIYRRTFHYSYYLRSNTFRVAFLTCRIALLKQCKKTKWQLECAFALIILIQIIILVQTSYRKENSPTSNCLSNRNKSAGKWGHVVYIEILGRCKRECGTSPRYTGIIIMVLIKRALIKSVRRRESAINNGPICSRYPTTRGPATQFTPFAFTMTTRWIRKNACYEKSLVFFFPQKYFLCFSHVEMFFSRR